MPADQEALEELLVAACDTYKSVMRDSITDKDRVMAANGARDLLKNMNYSATSAHPSLADLAEARKARLSAVPDPEDMADMSSLMDEA